MAVYTLAQLRTQARQLADAENDGHKTDAEFTTWINQGGQALHDIIVRANEDHHLTSVEFTLSSANTYTLPDNFYKLRGVDYQDGDRWFKVPVFHFAERDRYDETLYTGTYRLWYVLRYTPLVADADELDDLWSEYVVAYAARKCKMKEESDVSDLDRDIAVLADNARRMVAKRDEGGPRRFSELRRRREEFDDIWGSTRSGVDSRSRRYRLMQNAIFIAGRSID